MYPQPGQSHNTVFTRIEQSCIYHLSPTALRVYAATRSFANGHGKVTKVPQQRMAARSGVGRTQYIKGLREVEKAGAVTIQKTGYGRVSYTFTKIDSRYAAIPNEVLAHALINLSGRDLQVLLAMYLHVNTQSGLTWVGAGALARSLGMDKSNLFRALRNIQNADLATRCDDPECPAPKPHWHMTTHQGVSYTEQSSPEVSSASDTPKVSYTELRGCHQPNTIEDQVFEDQGTRELRSQSEGRVVGRNRDQEIFPGDGLWGEPVADQAVLAKDLRAAIYGIKPGIKFAQHEHSALIKWFRERIEYGWSEEVCRTAISRFVQDPGTEQALAHRRPHVAFFSWVRRNEGSFTATTSTRMREVEHRRDTEVRQKLRDLEERRRQRRAENERGAE